jgi:hypothetical protein
VLTLVAAASTAIYRIESLLHPPGFPVKAAVFGTAIKKRAVECFKIFFFEKSLLFRM